MKASTCQRIVLRLLQPKVGIPLLLLAMIVLGPVAYRGYRLSQVPDIGEPFDVEAFCKIEVADEDNAFVEYRAAVATLPPPRFGGQASDWQSEVDAALEGGWAAASEDVRHWLEDNRPALEIWRRGTTKPDALYYHPQEMRIDTLLPVTQELRTMARLARIEASRLEAEGMFEEAWEWHRASFRCSGHSGRHGCIIERLVGLACHSLACEGINHWAALRGVDTVLVQEALQAIQDDYALAAPPSNSLKAEYVMLTHPEGLLLSEAAIEFARIPKQIAPITLFVFGEPEVSQRVLRLMFHNYLSHIDTPRQQRPAQKTNLSLFDLPKSIDSRTVVLSPFELEEFLHRTLLARIVLPAITPYDTAVGRHEALQAALVISLALQWYYHEHKTFPETLQPLVGRYLEEIPLDPFGKPGDRMHYRSDGNNATVWSIGDDGIDNGGDVAGKSPRPQDIGYKVVAPVDREP